jgi:hypothetical protein
MSYRRSEGLGKKNLFHLPEIEHRTLGGLIKTKINLRVSDVTAKIRTSNLQNKA